MPRTPPGIQVLPITQILNWGPGSLSQTSSRKYETLFSEFISSWRFVRSRFQLICFYVCIWTAHNRIHLTPIWNQGLHDCPIGLLWRESGGHHFPRKGPMMRVVSFLLIWGISWTNSQFIGNLRKLTLIWRQCNAIIGDILSGSSWNYENWLHVPWCLSWTIFFPVFIYSSGVLWFVYLWKPDIIQASSSRDLIVIINSHIASLKSGSPWNWKLSYIDLTFDWRFGRILSLFKAISRFHLHVTVLRNVAIFCCKAFIKCYCQ